MLVAPAACTLALAGCGEQTISASESEDFVRDTLRAPQLVEDVVCPDGLEAEVGREFECKIVLKDGGEEVVRLRQTDDDVTIEAIGNRQTKAPTSRESFEIFPENVESLIRGAADERERIVSVDCPPDVPVRKGNDFECVAELDDGSELVYVIDQVDDLGNVKLAGTRKRKG